MNPLLVKVDNPICFHFLVSLNYNKELDSFLLSFLLILFQGYLFTFSKLTDGEEVILTSKVKGHHSK